MNRKLFHSLKPGRTRLAVEALEDRSVPASLSISDVTVMEGLAGTQNAALTVSLSEPTNKTITVNYNTSNSWASAGSDYVAVSGKLTFARGETTKTILVPVRGDRVGELYYENFFVNLSQAKNATIADYQGQIIILDSSPRLSVNDPGWVSEPDADEKTYLTFTVSLSAAYDETVTVNFRTRGGIAYEGIPYDGALAGQDYVGTFGTLTFAPGETSKTITVEILGDDVPEYDEWFAVDLSGVSANAAINQGGLGVIAGEYGTPPWSY